MKPDAPTQSQARLAYLYSRYPVVSQTFCDSEMLALEARGFDLDIASLNPPPSAFRHERFEDLRAEVFYPPPPAVLAALKARHEKDGTWAERFGDLVARHDRDHGKSFKAATRARNALYFAELFEKRGVGHIHVHFANRATHTALFIKRWAGIPFSFTAHAQDFMVDLGSDDLLRELCREAEFVVAVSDFSAELLRKTCPESAEKIQRVYNGIALDQFAAEAAAPAAGDPDPAAPLRIVSIGRLIEFKGFHHLVGACARLKRRGVPFHWTLVGDGPWREKLHDLAAAAGLGGTDVTFAGVQSQEAVKRLLARSDVFCLPCIVDGKGASDILPTVITEAMASSLPVVSTRLVGVPEMVVPEETGLLVEPGDEDALADALARLAADRALARRLGTAGRRRAGEIFELKTTAAQLAAKFDARPIPPAAPPETPLLYLIDHWPLRSAEKHLAGEIEALTQQGWVRHLTLSGRALKPVESGGLAAEIEYLPDAIVFEAEWRAQPDRVARVLEWRAELGAGIETEDFLVAARRALHLARLVAKRGVRLVHAARSDTLVTAWLVHRLAGVPFSFTSEALRSALGRETLDRLAAEAVLLSRADTADPADDRLCLRPPDRTRRLALGPLKLRLPGQLPEPDRAPVYEAWFRAFKPLIDADDR